MKSRCFIALTVKFEKEGDSWTAECIELGTAMFGDTFEEAKAAIEEAIELHLDVLTRNNALTSFCRKNGIKIFAQRSAIPNFVRVQRDPTKDSIINPIYMPINCSEHHAVAHA